MSDLPERSPQGAERWIVGGFAAGFFALMGMSLFEHYEPRKLGVIFVVVFWIPLLVIHEAGHAIVARLCGWEVERVVIGYGRTLRTFVVRGTPVIFRAIPLSGYVMPRPRDLQSPRLKNALIYAGGPAFELAAGLAVLMLTGPELMFRASGSMSVIAAQSFEVAVALGLLFTLVPHSVTSEGKDTWSDGMGILMSHRLPDAWFARMIRAPEQGAEEASGS